MMQNNDKKMLKLLMKFQKNEITEHYVYKKLGARTEGKNKAVLSRIAEDELKHYSEWKKITGREVKPSRLKIFFYTLLARIFGLTFAVKLMEDGEESAEKSYEEIITEHYPQLKFILQDERNHEKALVSMIEEERLNFIGSMILGLNDALVEITGALAGFTLALKRTGLIAIVGLITGISASLSMAASEYLSQVSEKAEKPLKAAFYTGMVYLLTVILLVLPFMLLKNPLVALAVTLLVGAFVVFMFSFFVAVVQDRDFKKMFLQMVTISFGVAAISFGIGYLVRLFFGVSE